MARCSIRIHVGGKVYEVASLGVSIAIPLDFDGPQPNTYGVAHAHAEAYAAGGWVGDTRRGGSCNFETYSFTPHCNGTHTECVGHITDERIRIHDVLQEGFIPSTLISITPVAGSQTADSYDPALNADDLVIDRAMLEAALVDRDSHFLQAIVIRTLPNSPEKMSRDYMQQAPAFFSLEAMQFLTGLGLRHLLVDMPSVDRLFDEGRLRNHHTFWGLSPGSHSLGATSVPIQTITEMVYVPGHVPDGNYLLNLQIAPFMADAAPSRPVLYPLIAV